MSVTKAAQRESTVRKLIDLGRELFSRHGYAETSMEELVAQAGVTRGALYHHFGSKEGLFKAVLEDVQRDVAGRVDTVSAGESEPWGQLMAGCRAFLAASLDPQVQRILLIDAPAVLGWDVWRDSDAENSMRLLGDVFGELMTAGVIAPQPLEALVHLVSGAMNEAALWIARSAQPEQSLEQACAVLEKLLSALRV